MEEQAASTSSEELTGSSPALLSISSLDRHGSGHSCGSKLVRLAPARSNLSFDPRPDARVASHRVVRPEDIAIEPGKGTASRRLRRIFILKVSDDLRSCQVRGPERAAAMDEAARLVKVLRAGNIRRNDAIVLPSLINAVDLDHEQDWNPAVFQFAGQLVGRGSPQLCPKSMMRASCLSLLES